MSRINSLCIQVCLVLLLLFRSGYSLISVFDDFF